MKLRTSFEAVVLAAGAAAMVVVAVLTLLTWKVANDATDAGQWVTHTHEVLTSLAQVRADSLQAELATQSYRMTGNPERLIERDTAIAARELLQQIHVLTSNNPAQQTRWTALRQVIDERMAISRQVELLRKTQGVEAANAYAATAPLPQTRARTYGLLQEMDREERQLLAQRTADHLQARQSLVGFGALNALALLVLLAAAYGVVRRQLRQTRLSQQALAHSAQSLSITLHSIGDGVIATDTRGCITRMNPVAERLTGWVFADAQGRAIEEVFHIIHEETREAAEVPVAQVLATGLVHELANHTVLLARDGSECPIADSAAPIRAAGSPGQEAGAIQGVVIVFRDETGARRLKQGIREQNALLEQRVKERTDQLHTSEAHLRGVINSVPALIAYVDAAQRYVYVNRQYQQRFAPQRADIIGCACQTSWAPSAMRWPAR